MRDMLAYALATRYGMKEYTVEIANAMMHLLALKRKVGYVSRMKTADKMLTWVVTHISSEYWVNGKKWDALKLALS